MDQSRVSWGCPWTLETCQGWTLGIVSIGFGQHFNDYLANGLIIVNYLSDDLIIINYLSDGLIIINYLADDLIITKYLADSLITLNILLMA